jgi:drug/metabolite transporter (DMT)-like permease
MQFIFREWWTNPQKAWPIIIAMGVCGSLAFAFVFNAYNIASPSLISLFEYSLILYSIIIGYLLFQEVPSLRTLLGASIIVSAGIYIYIYIFTLEKKLNLNLLRLKIQ